MVIRSEPAGQDRVNGISPTSNGVRLGGCCGCCGCRLGGHRGRRDGRDQRERHDGQECDLPHHLPSLISTLRVGTRAGGAWSRARMTAMKAVFGAGFRVPVHIRCVSLYALGVTSDRLSDHGLAAITAQVPTRPCCRRTRLRLVPSAQDLSSSGGGQRHRARRTRPASRAHATVTAVPFEEGLSGETALEVLGGAVGD